MLYFLNLVFGIGNPEIEIHSIGFPAERLNPLSLIREQGRHSQLDRDFEPVVPSTVMNSAFSFVLDLINFDSASFDVFSF